MSIRKLICVLIIVPTALLSQQSKTGQWYMFFGNIKLSKKLSWWAEVQDRNYNLGGDLEQLLLRTALTYLPEKHNFSVSQGYAFIESQNYAGNIKTHTEEHRLYQQLLLKQNFGRVFIQHRYRIEERFFAAQKLFKMRYRYFLSLNIPINKSNIEKNTFYISLYTELFIGNNPSYYDRDRLYGGLGFAINKAIKVEVAYMAQILGSSHRSQGMLSLFWSPDFSKKTE